MSMIEKIKIANFSPLASHLIALIVGLSFSMPPKAQKQTTNLQFSTNKLYFVYPLNLLKGSFVGLRAKEKILLSMKTNTFCKIMPKPIAYKKYNDVVIFSVSFKHKKYFNLISKAIKNNKLEVFSVLVDEKLKLCNSESKVYYGNTF